MALLYRCQIILASQNRTARDVRFYNHMHLLENSNHDVGVKIITTKTRERNGKQEEIFLQLTMLFVPLSILVLRYCIYIMFAIHQLAQLSILLLYSI